jgi:hypothetical protein
MSIVSTSRRASALAIVASAAISLPATASARPIDDPAITRPADQVQASTPGDGPVLAISLAGGALVLAMAGGGYLALRGPRVRPVPRVHAKI